MFEGNKTVRDYDNWKNKYVQIWDYLRICHFPLLMRQLKQMANSILTTSNYTAEKYSRKDMNRSRLSALRSVTYYAG